MNYQALHSQLPALDEREDPRFLLVDDDPVFAAVFDAISSDMGYRTQVVFDTESLTQIRGNFYEVIFLDYRMGNGNNLHLIPQINKDFPHSLLILISSDTNIVELQSEFPELAECLPKYYSPDEMIAMALIHLNQFLAKH